MSHTALYRLGGVLTLAVPILLALIAAVAVTDGLTARCAPTSTSPTLSDPHVSIAHFDRLRRVGDHDEALVALDVDFDLSSCATWNAKTVFAHVTLTYETATRARNEVTVWDATFPARRGEPARAHGRMMGKHRVRTVDDSILGAPLEVKLRWAVTPHAGMIRRGETSTWNGTAPEKYSDETPTSTEGAGSTSANAKRSTSA